MGTCTPRTGNELLIGFTMNREDCLEFFQSCDQFYPTGTVSMLVIGLVAIVLFVLARQIEYTLRLDFLWKSQSQGEKEQMDTLDEINVILLQNMLPKHVADYYTCRMHKGLIGDNEVYAQHYDHVAVMFASIPNFPDFYSEEDTNNKGIECLRLLNEIIADFDEVLSLLSVVVYLCL
jgi:adenylate cyclase 2